MGHWVPKEILPCPGTKAGKEGYDDPDPQPQQIHIQRNEQGAADTKSESSWKLQRFSDDFNLIVATNTRRPAVPLGISLLPLHHLQKDMGCLDPSQIPNPGVWNSAKSVSHSTGTTRRLNTALGWAQTPLQEAQPADTAAHTCPHEGQQWRAEHLKESNPPRKLQSCFFLFASGRLYTNQRRGSSGCCARLWVQPDHHLPVWELAAELQERLQAEIHPVQVAGGSRASGR